MLKLRQITCIVVQSILSIVIVLVFYLDLFVLGSTQREFVSVLNTWNLDHVIPSARALLMNMINRIVETELVFFVDM